MKKEEPNQRQQLERSTIDSLVKRFGWTFEEWMQDWPLEISDEVKISDSLQEYGHLKDDAERVILMKAILFALEESTDGQLSKHSKQVTSLLEKDFKIHEPTISYWILSENSDSGEFRITSLMRNILNNKK